MNQTTQARQKRAVFLMNTAYRYALPWRSLCLLLTCISAACLLTRVIHHYSDQTLVISALLNTVMWASIPMWLLDKIHISRFLLLDSAYVGAFIAMDASLQQPTILGMACALASVVYLISNRYLVGLGGRLGTQAFMTCTLLIGIHVCWSII